MKPFFCLPSFCQHSSGSAFAKASRLVALLLLLTAKWAQAADATNYILKPNEFPPIAQATYLAGELVVVDPINRRGGIRLDCGIRDERRAAVGPLHYFAMLPCGEIWLHGAPATLQDIPLGTHVQGYFFVPPAGEETTIAPPPKELASLIPPQNHALLLEDDVSFYQRHGQSWKILAVDFTTSKLTVESVGKAAPHGLSGKHTLDFDIGTRVWQAGRPVELRALKPGATVNLNLGRAVNWRDHEFGLNDVWLDAESLKQATDLQANRNVRYHRIRWLPGRVEAVENFDYGGGLVTVVMFGGVAKQLLDDLHADRNERIAVAPAEHTLRTWTHRSDRAFGKLVKWENAPAVPGFSGVRLHLKFAEMLDHYRPGNAVRVKAENWTWISNTPEERVKSFEDRERSRTLRLPGQVAPEEKAK
jgi:hypothetical protein